MESLQTKHILIVDDSLDQQSLLKILLEAKGYTTECTSNGEEALTLLSRTTKMPHAIILDLNMPVMSGLDFRRIQHADSRLKDIPVVIMSGDDDISSIRAIANSDVVKKPLSISLLMDVLEKNCNLH